MPKAECWNIPAEDGRPALTVVHEYDALPYVIGEHGPRVLAEDERERWERFKRDLARRY